MRIGSIPARAGSHLVGGLEGSPKGGAYAVVAMDLAGGCSHSGRFDSL